MKIVQGGITVISLAVSCLACIEIHPIVPKKDFSLIEGDSVCQPPNLAKNIVGTWVYESTLDPTGTVSTGTISFRADSSIIDPDFLFGISYGGNPIISKTYDPNYPVPIPIADYSGPYFFVITSTKKDTTGLYFTLVSNECDKIVLKLFNSGNKGYRLILTR